MRRTATLRVKKSKKELKRRKISAAALLQQIREIDLKTASVDQLAHLARSLNVYLSQVPHAHSATDVSSFFLDFFFHCHEEEVLAGSSLSTKLQCLFDREDFNAPENSAGLVYALKYCEDCLHYFNHKDDAVVGNLPKEEFFSKIKEELLLIAQDKKDPPVLQYRALHFLMLASILLKSHEDLPDDLFDVIYAGAVSDELVISPIDLMTALRSFDPQDAETGVQIFDLVFCLTFQVNALLKRCGIKRDVANRNNFSILYFYEVFSKADVELLSRLCIQLQKGYLAFCPVTQAGWMIFSNVTQCLASIPDLKKRMTPIQAQLKKETLRSIDSEVMVEHALSDELLALFDADFFPRLQRHHTALPAEVQRTMGEIDAAVNPIIETCKKLLDRRKHELVGLGNRYFAMRFLLTPAIFKQQDSGLQMYLLVAARTYANSYNEVIEKYLNFTSALDQSFEGVELGEEADFTEVFPLFLPEWIDDLDRLSEIIDGINQIKTNLQVFMLAFPKKSAIFFGKSDNANYRFFLDLHSSYANLSSQGAQLIRLLCYGRSLQAIYQDHIKPLCDYVESVIERYADPDGKLGVLSLLFADQVGMLKAYANLFQQLSQKKITEQSFINAILDRPIAGVSNTSCREILKKAIADGPLNDSSATTSTFLSRLVGRSPSKERFQSPGRSLSLGYSFFGRLPSRRSVLPVALFVTSNYKVSRPIELDFSSVVIPVSYVPRPDLFRRNPGAHPFAYSLPDSRDPSLLVARGGGVDFSSVTLDFSRVVPVVSYASRPTCLGKDSPLNPSVSSAVSPEPDVGTGNEFSC